MKHNTYKTLGILLLLLIIQGCAQPSVSEKEASRKTLNDMAELTVSELIKDDPNIKEEIAKSVGYMVTNWKVTKVPILGAGTADGVVVSQKTKEHTYVRVKRLDFGMGWGVRSFKNLTVFYNEALFEDVKDGKWKLESGAEVAAGVVSAGADTSALAIDYKAYMLLDGGGSATATLRAIKLTPNKKLN